MAINNELTTSNQTNTTWNLTLKASSRFPIIADRVFSTLDDANDYVNDRTAGANAYPGLILSVVNDSTPDNNGVYYVSSIPTDENELGALVKVGNSNSGNTEGIDAFNLSIAYDSDAKVIKLMSGTEQIGEAIDATDFIKDGMVNSAKLEERTVEGVAKTYLVLGFNTDGGNDVVEVDVTTLLNIEDINTLKNNMIYKDQLEFILDGYNLTGSPIKIKDDLNKKEDKPIQIDLNDIISLNEVIYSGKYIISGEIKKDIHSDFPIITHGNINAELTVYANEDNSYISQFIKFDNIDGGDCNLYTRVAINGAWENWQKIQGINEVNLIGFGQPKNFDNLIESGMYSGVNCYSVGNDTNGYPITRLETFVLIVVNANLTGGGISQLKYSLAEGNTTIMTRTKVDEQWGEWKNVGEFDIEGDRVQTITWGEDSNMNNFIEKGNFICNNASIWEHWKPQNLPNVNSHENIYISFNLKVTEVESEVTNGKNSGINHTVGQVLTLTNGTTRTTDIYIREYKYYTDNDNTNKDGGEWTEWRCLSSKEQGINAVVEDGVLIL